MFSRNKLMAAAVLLASIGVGGWQGSYAQFSPGKELSTVKVKITTLIAQPSGQQEPLKPYTAGSKVRLQTLMTNSSSEDLDFIVYDPYYQSRPELRRNGEAVPYRKEVSELVEHKDMNPRLTQVYFYRTLNRDKATRIEILDLDDWYDPLEPGCYTLSIRYRFEDGKWTPESSKIEFEVILKNLPGSSLGCFDSNTNRLREVKP